MNWRNTLILAIIALAGVAYLRFFEMKRPGKEEARRQAQTMVNFDRSRIDAIGLFTGQIGYSWNSFLLYGKGGAAVVRDNYDIFLNAPQGPLPTGYIAARGSETRWGGVVGVGGEFALTRNWSVALEYDHLFMGDNTVRMTFDPAFIALLNHDERIRQDVDMVTARINYRFGGLVVAKY